MKRFPLHHTRACACGVAIAAASCLATASFAQSAAPAPLRLTVNHAGVITLDATAAVALVANPDIADVVTERNNLVFVVARKPGATNLLVYDRGGKRLFDREIVVVPDESSAATITRVTESTEIADYVCNPRCVLSPHGGGPAPVAATGVTPAGAAAQIPPGMTLPLPAIPRQGG